MLYKPKLSLNIEISHGVTLKDHQRDRQVPIKVYYPQEPGLFPIIIFSHGSGGTQNSFSYLGKFWASHGYISIHPTHFGSDRSVLQTGGVDALEKIAKQPKHWQERAEDISFIIDFLPKLPDKIPQLTGKIDASVIGVAGHSYGAYTTMLLAGALVDTLPNRNINLQDQRACAFLAISPQGTGSFGLSPDSWNGIVAPVITISGTKETGGKGKPRSWRLEPFKYMPPGNKYHVLIQDAYHFSYNDDKGSTLSNKLDIKAIARFGAAPEAIADIHTYVQNASIALWDAYLKAETSALAYLNSKALQTYSDGKASIFQK